MATKFGRYHILVAEQESTPVHSIKNYPGERLINEINLLTAVGKHASKLAKLLAIGCMNPRCETTDEEHTLVGVTSKNKAFKKSFYVNLYGRYHQRAPAGIPRSRKLHMIM